MNDAASRHIQLTRRLAPCQRDKSRKLGLVLQKIIWSEQADISKDL
jgi:hypothetical protein